MSTDPRTFTDAIPADSRAVRDPQSADVYVRDAGNPGLWTCGEQQISTAALLRRCPVLDDVPPLEGWHIDDTAVFTGDDRGPIPVQVVSVNNDTRWVSIPHLCVSPLDDPDLVTVAYPSELSPALSSPPRQEG